MLWGIAVVLLMIWLLGLLSGFTMGSFIHLLFVAAVALLVVSISQEAMINQKLRRVLYQQGQNPDSRKTHRRAINRRELDHCAGQGHSGTENIAVL